MNVFLVDDEYWTLQSIKAKVDWASYGMNVIGEAYNGQEGLNEILRLKPDLVFTDIRMPGLTGLELIERARAAGVRAQFIIISGYSEFEYAQKALHLGAEGYILKSFEEQEIRPVLETVMKRRADAQESDMIRLMGALLGRTNEAELEVQHILNKWNLLGEDQSCTVVTIRNDHPEPKLTALPSDVLRIVTGKYSTAFVMATDQVATFISGLPAGLKGVGISASFNRASALSDEIQAAAEASCQYFVTGQTGEVYQSHHIQAPFQESILKLYEGIRIKDIADISVCFDGIKQQAECGELSIRHIYQLYNSAMSFVYHIQEEEDLYVHSYDVLLDMFENVNELLRKLKQLIVDKFEKESLYRPDEDSHENTKKFVSYIKEHYFESLTIHHLANHFNFNPNYVSQLFQKELQTTFTKYLLHVRLERACLLLKETELPVSEIAEKVGYSDYFYFAKIFKKSFNMTPTQFRTGQGQDYACNL